MVIIASLLPLALHISVLASSALSDVITNSVKQNVIELADCQPGNYRAPDTTCQKCSICLPTEYLKRPCNATHNVMCACRSGFYRDGGVCKECTKCGVGEGASPACSVKSNTNCIVCPPGSYSSVESSIKSCQSCTECGVNEISLQQCTAQQDTVCFKYQPKPPGSVSDNSVVQVRCKDGDVKCKTNGLSSATDNSYLYTAPLYCSLLGAIIVGLLVYVVFRCRMNRKRAAPSAALMQKQISPYQQAVISPAQSPYSFSRPHTYSYVFLDQNGQTVTASLRYKDLPSSLRRTIKRSLSHDGSWLKLATCLGYTPSEISRIQVEAERDNTQTSALSILLSDWSKKPYSTVGNIIQALAGINRHDLIQLIHSRNSMSGSEVV